MMDEFLEQKRKEIDALDKQIIFLINERFRTTDEIGEYKGKNDLPIYNSERETEVLENVRRYAHQISPNTTLFQLLPQIWTALIAHSRARQQRYIKHKVTFEV